MRLRDFSKDINKKFLSKDRILDLYSQARFYSEQLLHFYNLALDYRVSKLSKNQIEFVIPPTHRNLDEHHMISDQAYLSLGVLAFKTLWKKRSFNRGWKIEILKVDWQKVKACSGEVRLRWEMTELQYEVAMAEIKKKKFSDQNAVLYFYDETDQVCGELDIEARLTQIKMLSQTSNWK